MNESPSPAATGADAPVIVYRRLTDLLPTKDHPNPLVPCPEDRHEDPSLPLFFINLRQEPTLIFRDCPDDEL